MSDKKVIWITGASRGIGKSIATIFAKNNYLVVISSRSEKNLKNVATSLNQNSEICMPYVCDVSNEKNVSRTFNKMKEKFGRIDILINAAGIGVFKDIINLSLEDFKSQLEVNVLGTFLCTKAVLPLMMERMNGQIVNIISAAAIKPFSRSGAYGASKAAALMFSRILREEVKNYNIKVISIIPGATDTDIWTQKVREKYSELMMKPQDVAEIIFNVCNQSEKVITEEIIIKPITGDLN
jgi:short-subunit dehydrogenase